MLKITQVIGALTVEVTGDNERDIIQQLAFFGTLPSQCPVLDCAQPLTLTFKKVGEKGYTYYGQRCAAVPAHECNFGQRTDDHSLYYKGAESFEIEYKAREAQESGQGAHEPPPRRQQQWQEQPRDSFNTRDARPQRHAEGQGHTQPEGGGARQQQNGGPTSGQRTLMSKLLGDAHVTLDDAYERTQATKRFEEMTVGEAARFIDAVKLELGVK